MAFDAHKNFATSLVATAPSPATSGTSLVVTGGEGSRFPAASFNAVICPAGAAPTPANAEVVRVTNVSTDTFTITRAQESSSARTVIVGDRIYAGPTVKTLTDVEADLPSTIFDAKGDLLTASAADTPVRKAAGANGLMLQADSGQSDGLAWAAHPLAVPLVPLLQLSTKLSTSAASGTNYFFVPGLSDQINTSLSIANTTGLFWGSQLTPPSAITGYTASYLLEVIIQVGATAPARTFTITLNPMTVSAGAVTVGSAVTGSTVTVTTPAANGFRGASSATFTAPAAGFYAPIITISGTLSAAVAVFGRLYQIYV